MWVYLCGRVFSLTSSKRSLVLHSHHGCSPCHPCELQLGSRSQPPASCVNLIHSLLYLLQTQPRRILWPLMSVKHCSFSSNQLFQITSISLVFINGKMVLKYSWRLIQVVHNKAILNLPACLHKIEEQKLERINLWFTNGVYIIHKERVQSKCVQEMKWQLTENVFRAHFMDPPLDLGGGSKVLEGLYAIRAVLRWQILLNTKGSEGRVSHLGLAKCFLLVWFFPWMLQ